MNEWDDDIIGSENAFDKIMEDKKVYSQMIEVLKIWHPLENTSGINSDLAKQKDDISKTLEEISNILMSKSNVKSASEIKAIIDDTLWYKELAIC